MRNRGLECNLLTAPAPAIITQRERAIKATPFAAFYNPLEFPTILLFRLLTLHQLITDMADWATRCHPLFGRCGTNVTFRVRQRCVDAACSWKQNGRLDRIFFARAHDDGDRLRHSAISVSLSLADDFSDQLTSSGRCQSMRENSQLDCSTCCPSAQKRSATNFSRPLARHD